MKRILTALLLALCIFSLPAADLDITVSNGNFKLYDAYGERIDMNAGVSNLEGLIVLTEDEEVTCTTPYGDATLGPNSIFSILSLDVENPTFYLVNGSLEIKLEEDLSLAVYTPVSLTAVFEKGDYRIVTTDEEEGIYNYSETASALAFDALTGITYIIEPRSYSSSTANILNQPIDEDSEEVIEIAVPEAPSMLDVVRRLNLPSAPKVYVADTYLPIIPAVPTLFVDIDYGVPSRPDIESITYESGLIPPTVSALEVQKKTLTN